MGKKIQGIDVSHWNDLTSIMENNPEFVIIKLSEGLTFVDDAAKAHRKVAKQLGIPVGYYHYARAEKNDAVREAEFFVSNIPQEDFDTAVLVLDFEGKALSIKNVDDWALVFLMRVEQLTGKKPLIYLSQSVVKRFPKVAVGGFGLWVARYRNPLLGFGDIKPWKFAAMWQYTSKPLDRDYFYGTVDQFKKYGEVKHG